jgi:hypothetical protein
MMATRRFFETQEIENAILTSHDTGKSRNDDPQTPM